MPLVLRIYEPLVTVGLLPETQAERKGSAPKQPCPWGLTAWGSFLQMAFTATLAISRLDNPSRSHNPSGT